MLFASWTVQQATIAMVAPGISEALIKLPWAYSPPFQQVIAYNVMPTCRKMLVSNYDTFKRIF